MPVFTLPRGAKTIGEPSRSIAGQDSGNVQHAKRWGAGKYILHGPDSGGTVDEGFKDYLAVFPPMKRYDGCGTSANLGG